MACTPTSSPSPNLIRNGTASFNASKNNGGDFTDYVDKRSPSGDFPEHMVKIREGNNETVNYFITNDELDQFKALHPDLFSGDTEVIDRRREGPTRRAKYSDLHHESKAVAELLDRLTKKGMSVEHYAAQDKPLFELIEGEGEKAHVEPLFSIPEILNAVKAVGKKGIQMTRFKGLGEMDAKELFETTMNPAKRKLLRIDLTDAIEAEEMFTKLMGDDVEPRRQFIEDNALNVRNLDVQLKRCSWFRVERPTWPFSATSCTVWHLSWLAESRPPSNSLCEYGTLPATTRSPSSSHHCCFCAAMPVMPDSCSNLRWERSSTLAENF